jgi:hypothetical protein
MQPDKLRVSREFKFEILSGRFFKFLHPCKFNKTSFSKCPMDSCTSTKLVQPLSIRISKCGSAKKFGNWVRHLEPLRFRTFNLLSTCQQKKKKKKNKKKREEEFNLIYSFIFNKKIKGNICKICYTLISFQTCLILLCCMSRITSFSR